MTDVDTIRAMGVLYSRNAFTVGWNPVTLHNSEEPCHEAPPDSEETTLGDASVDGEVRLCKLCDWPAGARGVLRRDQP